MAFPVLVQRTASYNSGSTSSASAAGSSSGGRKMQNAGPDAFVNRSFLVKLAATDTPQQALAIHVPEGKAVRIRANNGTTAGNAQVIYVAEYRNQFGTVGGTPLAPLDDVLWPVNNTGKIWAYGTAGDGVVVSIITPAGF